MHSACRVRLRPADESDYRRTVEIRDSILVPGRTVNALGVYDATRLPAQ